MDLSYIVKHAVKVSDKSVKDYNVKDLNIFITNMKKGMEVRYTTSNKWIRNTQDLALSHAKTSNTAL